MAKGAQAPELEAAFEKHREETEGQVERLDQVFEIWRRAVGKTCPAIDGLIEEGRKSSDELEGAPALDAGLLAAAQAVEHYEISRYGTLKRWAELLGMKDAAKLLDATLAEEARRIRRSQVWPMSSSQKALYKAAEGRYSGGTATAGYRRSSRDFKGTFSWAVAGPRHLRWVAQSGTSSVWTDRAVTTCLLV